ncbi:MAG: helix-turn-helix domain-containing protein [Saprospiraceae bacterium]|nr:helix-turn-helix domain-containing protein [Saprospiraceae bacterium]
MIRNLHIRNMVCSRCIKVVRQNLRGIGLDVQEVSLGVAKINIPENGLNLDDIRKALEMDGFELIQTPQQIMVEAVKHALILRLESADPKEHTQKLSDFISARLKRDYAGVSKSFSKSEKMSINNYYIRLKLEKAKELIKYGELSFKEIAFNLGYSSLQHLSGQFTKTFGLSMSDYKLQKHQNRDPLDQIV